MFGTDDAVYVPENEQLILDDVYRWKRYKFDVRKFGLRVRTEAFEQVSERMRAALETAKSSPRFSESIEQITGNVDMMLHDLAAHAGSAEGAMAGDLQKFLRTDGGAWWVRISDLPAESWFEEDYEVTLERSAKTTPYFTYGSVNIAQLDKLEVALPEEGVERPIVVDVPEREGATRWTIPPMEPLPIVEEFCGVHGASSRGRTVNLNTSGEVAENHQFCTPLGKIGRKLFATLYFHYNIPTEGAVAGHFRQERLMDYVELLSQSRFRMMSEGPTWRIYQREEDIVHLYSGLAGKESEGVETMPPFLIVACANGQFDPVNRSELYEAIRESVDQIAGK